ncbi:hypothetical protein PGT21_035072 [Puccinia graminis f. sp. tritici]|uniref:Uncharacterized protein n=1 Tax=Puccinia graminis f. sp. tritici TaxID=56615 RepID=A0A5B0QCL8_PUCGR|nr:hypothetical protein PGT21_035072 [Puccinia graminis f. sp. tritici]
MVKHERTHLRNLEPRVRELGPVPKLFDLLVLIDRAFQPRNALRTLDDIQATLISGVRVRTAMLRLLTIHHLVHRAPGDTRSQWDLIDDHLEAIREKSHIELQAHSILILRRDRELFPGDIMFSDVPLEMIRLPNALESDIEVLEAREVKLEGIEQSSFWQSGVSAVDIEVRGVVFDWQAADRLLSGVGQTAPTARLGRPGFDGLLPRPASGPKFCQKLA